MSLLTRYRDGQPPSVEEASSDGHRIAQELAALGVRFERWSAEADIPAGADASAVLSAYATPLARLSAAGGYLASDVVRVERGAPGTRAMREKFLAEHRHTEDEVRFFVEGSGTFYLHPDDRVFVLLCERGDLLGVPANVRHWFDMGTDPFFCAIRLFKNPEGWVGHFTGDGIAQRYPTHDAVVAGRIA